MPANREAWRIISHIDGGLITRSRSSKKVYWGMNFQTIAFAFDVFGVTEDRAEMLEKILIYAGEAISAEAAADG